MVKLTRTLAIIPTVLIFAFINMKLKQKEAVQGQKEKVREKVSIFHLCPWFILFFVLLSIVNSFGVIPAEASVAAKGISKFLMVAALGAIGLNTSFSEMKKSGIGPMFHGFIISLLVVIVAIGVEWCMGIV